MDLQKILTRERLANSEEVVVALYEPSWDHTKQRGTNGTFKSPTQSVSRLGIYPIEEIVEIFRKSISAKIQGYGVISVERIKAIGLSGDTPIHFEVTADPIQGGDEVVENLAHAEIIAFDSDKKETVRKKVTASACEKLCDAIEVTVI